ncbi:MAG: hypothetical protein Q9197_001688 [Variospora fuerteventurae]
MLHTSRPYVGTLHEINSDNSTVALENVVSWGTEGRDPENEVPPSDTVYEYIVFRGSDVKDLRIEEPPKENKPPRAPQVPDDPAILGSARRPTAAEAAQKQQQDPQIALTQAQKEQGQQPFHIQQRQQQSSRFPRHSPFPPYYNPYGPPLPNQRFGPHGFPPGQGVPGMPYGGPPPGWYPPPGQGFPPQNYGQYGHGPPPQMPIGSGNQQNQHQSTQQENAAEASREPPSNNEDTARPAQPSPSKLVATVKLPSSSTIPAPQQAVVNGPPPPTESKPAVAAALAPPAPAHTKPAASAEKDTHAAQKNGRILPAIPRVSPAVKPAVPVNGALQTNKANTLKPQPEPKDVETRQTPAAVKSVEEATRDARAAVAAAMAKLPVAGGQQQAKKPAPTTGKKDENQHSAAFDNLKNKVNEMRINDDIRTSRQPGTGGYAAGHRGRNAQRGGRARNDSQTKKVEVPTTDYDFEEANAKFNKQDLVKEAIASGSPLGSPLNGVADIPPPGPTSNEERKASEASVSIAPPGMGYNKTTSFFDNISSESKEREEGTAKRGGREFRNEEVRKNLETFGQGSVDGGFGRGGYRGRGRGRGYAGRGRGEYGNGRVRGGRGRASVVAES